MPVCHEKKLAFCHIPRTGGRSITEALKLKPVEMGEFHEPTSYYRKHYPDYHLFVIYRPHEDRVFSALKKIITQDNKNRALNNVRIMILPNDYFLDAPVDDILKFNDLEDDLNAMLVKLGHEPVKLKKIN